MNLKTSLAIVALIAGAACSSPSKPEPKALSFASCAEAKAAGYQNMARGAPGYSTRLDADGDGVACVS